MRFVTTINTICFQRNAFLANVAVFQRVAELACSRTTRLSPVAP